MGGFRFRGTPGQRTRAPRGGGRGGGGGAGRGGDGGPALGGEPGVRAGGGRQRGRLCELPVPGARRDRVLGLRGGDDSGRDGRQRRAAGRGQQRDDARGHVVRVRGGGFRVYGHGGGPAGEDPHHGPGDGGEPGAFGSGRGAGRGGDGGPAFRRGG